MKAPERTLTPRFTRPTRQIVTMLLVVAAFVAGAYVAYPRVAPVFLANPWLNGVIGGVFVFGVLACFWQVLQLFSSVGWIESFVRHRDKAEMGDAPRLLAPLAALLGSRGATAQIGASSARSILDSVATRIDEARDNAPRVCRPGRGSRCNSGTGHARCAAEAMYSQVVTMQAVI